MVLFFLIFGLLRCSFGLRSLKWLIILLMQIKFCLLVVFWAKIMKIMYRATSVLVILSFLFLWVFNRKNIMNGYRISCMAKEENHEKLLSKVIKKTENNENEMPKYNKTVENLVFLKKIWGCESFGESFSGLKSESKQCQMP